MSGFVECAICDISLFGTNATLTKHINDVHNNGQKKNELMRIAKNSSDTKALSKLV